VNFQNNKSVLITGASTGIGRALALVAVKSGYSLLLMARRFDLLEALRTEILAQHPQAQIKLMASDVADHEKHMQDIINLCAGIPTLDMVIANAGVGQNTGEWKNTWTMTKYTMDINVLGAIATIEAAKDIMLKQGFGHIVGITSVAAFRGFPETSAYSASKAALASFFEAMRADLTPNKITVTAVHPGFVWTPMTEKNGKMPFLISADVAAQKIWRALEKKRTRVVVPRVWHIVKWLMRLIPDGIFDWLMRLTRHRVQAFRKDRS
jgi:short-subunit dehydrogenase